MYNAKDKFIGKWAFPSEADESLEAQVARRGNHDWEAIAKDIQEKLQIQPNNKVLDVCCGNAALTQHLARMCREIHGVDFDKILFQRAEELRREENISNLQLHLANALEIDKIFSENYFDKSYCYFSFQYFNKKSGAELIRTLSIVTKRGGKIFLGDIPDKTRRWNFYKNKFQFYRERLSHFVKGKDGECDLGWWWMPEKIISICKNFGLNASILQQDKNLPHAHYRFDVLIKKK